MIWAFSRGYGDIYDRIEHFALADVVAGKAFDDRLGCFIMGEVLKRLQGIDHPIPFTWWAPPVRRSEYAGQKPLYTG
mgnify:CR=1 FL=1